MDEAVKDKEDVLSAFKAVADEGCPFVGDRFAWYIYEAAREGKADVVTWPVGDGCRDNAIARPPPSRAPDAAHRRVPDDAVDACRDADDACRFAAHAVDAYRDAAQ